MAFGQNKQTTLKVEVDSSELDEFSEKAEKLIARLEDATLNATVATEKIISATKDLNAAAEKIRSVTRGKTW
jgi:proteasome assembly chaperone (PAC2) family protein